MINFDLPIDREELNKASENLPNDINIRIDAEPIGRFPLSYNYGFFLVGKDEEDKIRQEDIIFLCLRQVSDYAKWIEVKMLRSTKCADSFILDFNKVPKHIQSMDLYFNNDEEILISKYKIQFETVSNEKLFGYEYDAVEENPHLFCGTFARVSNGWKFYPQFIEHSVRPYEIEKFYDWKEP